MMKYLDTGLKKFPAIHDRLAIKIDAYKKQTYPKGSPKWKTILIQKDPQIGTAPNK